MPRLIPADVPVVITSKSLLQTPVMNTPVSNQEIEVVGAFHVILRFSISCFARFAHGHFLSDCSRSYLVGGCIFAKGEISRLAPTSEEPSSFAFREFPVFWLSEGDTRWSKCLPD